jgi:hypothetical protein
MLPCFQVETIRPITEGESQKVRMNAIEISFLDGPVTEIALACPTRPYTVIKSRQRFTQSKSNTS